MTAGNAERITITRGMAIRHAVQAVSLYVLLLGVWLLLMAGLTQIGLSGKVADFLFLALVALGMFASISTEPLRTLYHRLRTKTPAVQTAIDGA